MTPIVGVRTDRGRVRDGNEDAYLVEEPLFGIADGMGGHIAGDVASNTAVDTIGAHAREEVPRDPDALVALVQAANQAIIDKTSEDPTLQGMGTTCTLILAADDHIDLAHVGDSRGYLYRDDELSQITEDHTLVGRMVREGRLDPQDAERHPQRNIITRALGIDRNVIVDKDTLPIQPGDRVLICSDGLTSMIDAGAIAEVLGSEPDPQAAADRLVDLANEAGGEDNITVVVLAFDDGGPDPERLQARQPTPIETPAATATASDRDRRDVPATGRSGGWGRKVVVTLLIIVLLLGGVFAFFRFVIVANSYFVATASDGHLAIYRGLPDDVFGVTFQEEIQTSTTTVGDLPEFLQEDVSNGIDADSLSDARTTLHNLEDRARDREFDKNPTRNQKGSK
ncbi:MAG TPA: Stp1/IreP family PP2C-type Ser/Thr phosphatase [Actinomycetota bacterium]|nr:Stp1/IreP family PP2C-type Ser/Thr phosphatase [Actinomycetota bacterium]